MSTVSEQQFTELYNRQVNVAYRVCYAYMKSPSPTEDAVQETFLRLLTKAPVFDSESHEVAWVVRTATNVCKDMLKSWWRRKITLDDTEGRTEEHHIDTTLLAVLSLPDKYKSVVYLFYYEGYQAAEIAEGLGLPASTVRNYLSEARKLLRTQLGGEFDEE